MQQNNVKHGGCKDCGSKTQKVLVSVLIPGGGMGAALCDECLKKRGIKIIKAEVSHE